MTDIFTRSLEYAFPPDGGLGELACFLGCSLLAGHVGNIEGSTGRGFSLKYSCLMALSADILRDGLYVKNLWKKIVILDLLNSGD